MQWGPLQFHQQSLRNLAKAMLRTRRLCAVMVDTQGREIFIRREYEIGEDGWPKHGKTVAVGMGDTITLTTDPNAKQTDTLFPVNYDKLSGVLSNGSLCARLTLVHTHDLLTAAPQLHHITHPDHVLKVATNSPSLAATMNHTPAESHAGKPPPLYN